MLFLFFLNDVIIIFFLVNWLRLFVFVLLRTFVKIFRFLFLNWSSLTLIFWEFLIENRPKVSKHFICLSYVTLSNLKNGFFRYTIVLALDEHANSLKISELIIVVAHPCVDYQQTDILLIHSLNQLSNVRFELSGESWLQIYLERIFIKLWDRSLNFTSKWTFIWLRMMHKRLRDTILLVFPYGAKFRTRVMRLLLISSRTCIERELLWWIQKGRTLNLVKRLNMILVTRQI